MTDTTERRHVITLTFCNDCMDRLDHVREREGPNGHGTAYCSHFGTFAMLGEAESVLYRPCGSAAEADRMTDQCTRLRAAAEVAREAISGRSEPRH
jgi:hypothetical protein